MKAVKLPFYGYSLQSVSPKPFLSRGEEVGRLLLFLHEQICPEQFPHFITIHPPCFFSQTRWVPILFSHMVWQSLGGSTKQNDDGDICHNQARLDLEFGYIFRRPTLKTSVQQGIQFKPAVIVSFFFLLKIGI